MNDEKCIKPNCYSDEDDGFLRLSLSPKAAQILLYVTTEAIAMTGEIEHAQILGEVAMQLAGWELFE